MNARQARLTRLQFLAGVSCASIDADEHDRLARDAGLVSDEAAPAADRRDGVDGVDGKETTS